MKKKHCIVVVDMQNDFVNPNGVLYINGADKLTQNISALIQTIGPDRPDLKWVFTMDSHKSADYATSVESKDFPLHCEYGSWGWKIPESISNYIPYNSSYVPKTSFGVSNWKKILGPESGYAGITLMGVAFDKCVAMNALLLRAAYPNTPISILRIYTASIDKEEAKELERVLERFNIECVGEEIK